MSLEGKQPWEPGYTPPGMKPRPEGLRLRCMSMELREALYDLCVARSSTKNEHVQKALERDIEQRVVEHYQATLCREGLTASMVCTDLYYERMVLTTEISVLGINAEVPEIFTFYLDLGNGEAQVYPGSLK